MGEREKTAAEAVRAWLTSDVGLLGGLRAICVDPFGSADQVQRLRDRVAFLEIEVRSARNENNVLRERLDKALVRAETAERERDDARAECTRLRERVAELEAERNDAWHTKYYVSIRKRAEDAEKRVAELEVEHDRASAYYAVVQERDDARAESARLRERVAELDAELERLRDLVSGLERGQLDCQDALARSEAECLSLRERADKAIAERNHAFNRREAALVRAETAERERDQAKETCEVWQNSHRGAAGERDRYKYDWIRRGTEIDRLQRELADSAARADAAEAREQDMREATSTAVVQTWINAANEWQAKYEALHAKATPTAAVLSACEAGPFLRTAKQGNVLADFARSLAAVTQPETPKRKTRLEAAKEFHLAQASCGSGSLDRFCRGMLEAAGIEDPDEELPEVTNG